ncbi:FG-GAP repeat domain-containing protein [Vibrio penaeicida]|uniref:FG-GAP repeat domain-containing protein n=1 Tax=Vibrio penaeicida TaxID=104609 RepID=UPI000CE9D023|nr:VCBS repeat-containing protein [Vibrio penaeicida]
MLCKLQASSALGMAILLSACGGGGGDSTSENGDAAPKTEQINSNSKILKNATQHSESELKVAAKNLVELGYSGESQAALLDASIVKQASSTILNREYGLIFLDDQIDNFIAIENVDGKLFTCGESGFVDISSTVDGQSLGTVSLDFNDCITQDYKTSLSGMLAVSFNDKNEKTYYFDNLDIEGLKVTGYTQVHYSEFDERGFERTEESRLLYSYDNGRKIKVSQTDSMRTPDYYEEINVNVDGTVWLGESGKVSVSSQGLKARRGINFFEGSMSFNADSEVQLLFSDKFFTYKKDIERDGSFDVGTHLSKVSGFQFVLTQPMELYPLDSLTQPPAFTGMPSLLSYNVSTANTIVVESSEFSDPDTPAENVQLSYRWYINNELVEGEITNTLPAYTAAYGDEVKVQAVIFDGTSSITSEWAYIFLNDTKPVIKTDNLPAQVFSGDELQFGVSLFDLDTNDSERIRMESGPDGATISSDGVISWTAPSDFLFPTQAFEFTFKSVNDDHEEYVLKVEVSDSKAEPIARSGEYSPFKEDSIVIDDFDGDGLNEFLTTDNGSGLSLYYFESGQYKQKWMYPYQLPSNGLIQQVHYLDIDNDLKKEIVIVTSKNILTLEDLTSKPKVVFEASQNILRAAFADTNNDGTLEVAVLHYDWEDYKPKLSAFSWNDFSNPLIAEIDVTGTTQLVYSNVDNDQSPELILNSGLVIDTSTWAIQWNYNGRFSVDRMIIEDFNQDGVNEIVGRDNFSNFSSYSAVTNTLISLSSTQSLSPCDLETSYSTIGVSELLVMNCSHDGVKAFKLEGGTLSQVWQLPTSSSYDVSSLTIGDFDNDSNLELLWGTSHSYSLRGFASADISGNSVTLKHTSIVKPSTAFRTVGWANITPVKEKALFLVGKYGNSDVRDKFTTVSSEGKVNFSSGTSYTNYSLLNTVHTDFDSDGYSEIVIPKFNYGVSKIELIQLDGELVKNSPDIAGDNGDIIVKASDFNQDGKKEVVLAHGTAMTIYDVTNDRTIASYQHSQSGEQIREFEVYDAISGSIIVSHGHKLSLLKVTGSSMIKKSTYNLSNFGCRNILVFNHDSDSSKEIACFSDQTTGKGNQLVVFEVEGNTLIFKEQYSLKFHTKGIAVNLSKADEQGFLLTTEEDMNVSPRGTDRYHVRKTDNKGNTIWKSPPLIGEPSSHGIKIRTHPEKGLQALVSTDQAMYQINP